MYVALFIMRIYGEKYQGGIACRVFSLSVGESYSEKASHCS